MKSAEEISGLRAPDLAALLGLKGEILDSEDAAEFLGIQKNSLEYAMYRGRVPYVQYGPRRMLTKTDLIEYRQRRDRGRRSGLKDATSYVVKE